MRRRLAWMLIMLSFLVPERSRVCQWLLRRAFIVGA